MTAEASSILAQKIKSASFDISIYPTLDRLTKVIGRNVADAVMEFTQLPTEAGGVASSMREGAGALEAVQETAALFWVGAGKNDGILVSLAPGFVAAFGERLLGGDFVMSESGSPTNIDLELAKEFASGAVLKTASYCQSVSKEPRQAALHVLKRAGSLEECKKASIGKTYFVMDVSVSIEEQESVCVAGFYFPVDFLDKHGFLERGKGDSFELDDTSQWRADMSANVDQIALDLEITMGGYKSTLSELSKLEVDQIIPLDENACSALDITLLTNKGVVVLGKGKLGSYKKMKAIKLTSDLAPTF